MRTYNLHGLTGYAADAITAALGDRELVELLREHRADPDGLLRELRGVVAAAAQAAPGADDEFVSAALDSVDWKLLVDAVRELVEVEVELPCGHGTAVLESFGGYDARHGGESAVSEEYECSCPSCQHTWQITLSSKAAGLRELSREFTFALRPEQAVYRQRATFNDGELPTSTSGSWAGARPRAAHPLPGPFERPTLQALALPLEVAAEGDGVELAVGHSD